MPSERKIGGVLYRCEKAPAEESLDLFSVITDTFAGDLSILSAIGASATRQQLLGIFVMAHVSSALDSAKVKALIVRCVTMCTTGGDPCILGHKPQDLSDAIEVAFFAMQTNLRDFLAESLPKGQATTQQEGAA